MCFLGDKLPPDQVSGDIRYDVSEYTGKHIRLVDGESGSEQTYPNSHWSVRLHVDQSKEGFVLWCKVQEQEENELTEVAKVKQDKQLLLEVIANDSDNEMNRDENRDECDIVRSWVLAKQEGEDYEEVQAVDHAILVELPPEWRVKNKNLNFLVLFLQMICDVFLLSIGVI